MGLILNPGSIRVNPNSSDLIRKKFSILFNVNRLKINPSSRFLIVTKIQSYLIRLNPRLPIRINTKEVLNPNESEVRTIQTEFSIQISPNDSDRGFIRIRKLFGFIRIQSLGLTRIKSDRFSTDSHQTRLKFFFGLTRIGSDWLGYRFRNKSDWFGINFNPKLLPGQISIIYWFVQRLTCNITKTIS